ncbi:MAG: trehalose-phosphatase [Gammaproteobacteria bacterium]
MTPTEGLDRNHFDAVLFDLDGVVTDTASAHAAAWKGLFDAFLARDAARREIPFRPFDPGQDYRAHVDGKPRYDGVRSFLESRGIELPFGDPDDDPSRETVCGLGNRKDRQFNSWLRQNKVRAFPGTIEFVEALRAHGVATAIFSASRNLDAVLASAGVDALFDAKVDGLLASQLDLPGKPEPATLLMAAEQLGAPADRCVIVEDAIAGVEAGRRGGFHSVVGIDRGGYAESLRDRGADLVVNDLSEFRVDRQGNVALKHCGALPSIWDHCDSIEAFGRRRRLAVLLDYDGTLTPIVADYRRAEIDESMRATLRVLAQQHTVGVISGRDLPDVQHRVGIDSLFYSGSHGFELAGPDGWHRAKEGAQDYISDLDQAEVALVEGLASISGHAVERKHFAIAVHYRQVDEALVGEVRRVVDRVIAGFPRLAKSLGKKVFELKPALQWDKGRAVELLLQEIGMSADETLALYIGDDVTDEAVFQVLRPPNISIALSDNDRVTAADYSLRDCNDVRRFLDWLSRIHQVPGS